MLLIIYGQALFASGDVEGAFDILHQAWQVAQRTSAWFEEITISREVEWYLALDNLDAALECLHQAQVDIDEASRLPLSSLQKPILMPFTVVQIFLAQKQYSKALTLATHLFDGSGKKEYRILFHTCTHLGRL